MRGLLIASVGFAFAVAIFANSDSGTVSLADLAQHAVDQSKITLPASTPFHLKARIVETTNPDSNYKAEVEEYWLSPEKWRRTISSPDFSQTLIVNGNKVFEQDKGEYFPWWLNDLVTAMVDPLPMIDQLKNTNSRIQKPNGSEHSTTCARFQTKVGIPPAENSAFLVFCFEGSKGLPESVVTPEFEAEFKDFKDFKGKQVPRRIVIHPEPGTAIEATTQELTELSNPDANQFSITQATPAEQQLRSIQVTEAIARTLSLKTPDIVWPSIRSGKASGVLSIHISVDRNGHVREAWPLNSDNANLDDSVREQVMNWQFKTAVVKSTPIQMETVLTFKFDTKVENALAILNDTEARKLATNTVEATIAPGSAPSGTTFVIRGLVDTDGNIGSVQNTSNVPTNLFLAGYQALKKWHFAPYLRDGKPDTFYVDIAFHVQ